MIILQNLYTYKSLTPSKSMPQKSSHDFKEKYPYVHVGTFKPMRTEDILTNNSNLPSKLTLFLATQCM